MSKQVPQHLLNSSLYICKSCRDSISSRRRSPKLSRPLARRWIGRNHVRNIITAEKEWNERAEGIQSGEKQSILELLEERGYVSQIVGTREELSRLLNHRRVGIYVGIDPTAPSMHVGHMVPFMALSWLYVHGYSAHFLLGGFTSRIGDPTGRLKGREDQNTAERKANMAAMHLQLRRFGASMERYAERRGYKREWAWRRSLINNMTWWSKTPVAEFMRILGTQIRIGPMLGRDTVKNRMEKGDGMSFAEFSYPLVQGWDWWELYQKGVQVQIGGADQFGNILAGIECIKKIRQSDPEWSTNRKKEAELEKDNTSPVTDDPLGFTVPLLTTSSGEKFGKSAGNAVWLDGDMTSPYDLYQFFLRSTDADVEKYLKLLTLLPLKDIEGIMQRHNDDQSKRVAQHTLARDFVEMIHGVAAAEQAGAEHRKLFSRNLKINDVQDSVKSNPVNSSAKIPPDLHPSLNKHAQPLRLEDNASNRVILPQSLVVNQALSRVLWHAQLAASRSEGQRLITNRGVYIGGRSSGDSSMDDSLSFLPAKDASWSFFSKYIIENNLLILRLGKWKVKLIKIVPDAEYEAAGMSCPGWKDEESLEERKVKRLDIDAEEAEQSRRNEEEAKKLARKRQNPFGKVIDARFE